MTTQLSVRSLFSLTHDSCDSCKADGRSPKALGRKCTHRHIQVTQHNTPTLEALNLDVFPFFPSDNEARIFLNSAGLLRWKHLEAAAERLQTSVRDLMKQLGQDTLLEALACDGAIEPFLREKLASTTPSALPVAPTPEELPQQELWVQLANPLKNKVSEENFDIWLSCLFVVEVNHPTMILGSPNSFFQEYLTEHYKEVIQEELAKVSELSKVEFVVAQRPTPTAPQAPSPETAPTPASKTELLPVVSTQTDTSTPTFRKLTKRKEDREKLARDCVFLVNNKPTFFPFIFIDLLKLLKAREDEEDRVATQREGFERWQARQDQHPKDSAFDSTKPIDRKQYRKMAKRLGRDLDRGRKPKPPNSG
jgi:hypothetical protein